MNARVIVVGLLLVVGALCSQAASYTIPWNTIDGGGGTSTSADGRFSVSGSAGQPDASGPLTSTDGRFHMTGGFWQAEVGFCGCTLSATLSGGNIVVSWPCGSGGCILEYTDELYSPGSTTVWHPVSPQPVGDVYTAPLMGTQRYFRLRSP